MTKFSTKSAILAVAAVAMTSTLAAIAHAEGDQRDFRFVNQTGDATIQAAWIAPAIAGTPWSSIDLSSPIGPRSGREISLSGWNSARSHCYFDVKAALDNGSTVRFNNVNLCRVMNLNVN